MNKPLLPLVHQDVRDSGGASHSELTTRTRKYWEAHERALRHAYDEAGVTGVPMFLIGKQVLTGLQEKETLEEVIREEQARNLAN